MPTDIPSDVGPFGLKFHQVAFYTSDLLAAVNGWQQLGFNNWVFDSATLEGARIINNEWQDVKTKATMAFNYDILPMELECLTYDGGEHRHRERAILDGIPFISHLSVHVRDVAGIMEDFRTVHGIRPYHVFVTKGHTNVHIAGKKRFVECIYDTRKQFGYDIKLIQRIAWGSQMTAGDLLNG